MSLKPIFDLYLNASLHVALSVAALVLMTQHMFGIQGRESMPLFAAFSTIVGYNFVKYHTLVFSKKQKLSPEMLVIIAISAISAVCACWNFLQLSLRAQFGTSIFAILTVLYALPFFPNRKNARNWAGVKIYIVSLCWAGVTVALPLLDAQAAFTPDFLLKFTQRFLLVFVLILIFEIVDMTKDDPLLKTVPQQIGQRRTKILGIALLILFYALELLRSVVHGPQLWANFLLVLVTALMLVFANPRQSRYYSAFWAESIPILWWLLILLS